MGPQIIDYRVVIADLERKRELLLARFDAAIAALKQVLALENETQPSLPGVETHPTVVVLDGPYRGLQMLEAAILHLSKAGKPIPNVQLAKELEAGGYRHKSKNFPNTLNSVLWRHAKATGQLDKTSKGWELRA